ncbi:hypothetical protein JOC36_000711 [Weissella uvarum]|uniref:hypothetical protein n=1 Tax=Weissella uvarum TaxID=1479233 RepID=UPI00195F44BE|nr:hypothetical protein [Weissella uvarum]MBM7617162.1 hypothetical protein [Weissella uvarum]MCM0595458.1 hypothetical protein [Weissella uvarum]
MKHVHEYSNRELIAILNFAFIDNFDNQIPIRKVTQAINISPDTYYKYRNHYRATHDLSVLKKLPSSALLYFVKAYNQYHQQKS